ncbi:MAG: hypothetical protein LBQ10_04660 [Desulfovibrio sp.]|jgi:hypothetical protein|nr:hypothetical protein [Desulfovibrio sp.]
MAVAADVRVCAEADGVELALSEAAVFLKAGESGRVVFPLVIGRVAIESLLVEEKYRKFYLEMELHGILTGGPHGHYLVHRASDAC